MMVSTGAAKRFIFDVVYYTGERDLKGQPVQRNSFCQKTWRVAISLRERLIADLELLVGDFWVPMLEVKEIDKVLGERFKTGDFELSDSEVEFIKENIKGATSLPLIATEVFNELSGLI